MTEKIYNRKIGFLSRHIINEYHKGKIPLFVIGSGVSMDLKKSTGTGNSNKESIPSIDKMIEKLHSLYNVEVEQERTSSQDELERRFQIWEKEREKTVDRSNVAGILRLFQETEELKNIWINFNEWLLNNCVDENLGIGIVKAEASGAHEKIVELYDTVGALCITTNFDGLLYRVLKKKYDNLAHTYYTEDDVKRVLSDERYNRKVYAEIQIRGDIFYAECNKKWCEQYDICEDRSSKPIHIWEFFLLKCRRGQDMKPFISFPGTYEKDKEVRGILGVLWQYLVYRVSCVVTIGLGGLWDPILVAFLSEIANERNIPFADVNIETRGTYLRREIVDTDTSGNRFGIDMTANDFMAALCNIIYQEIEEYAGKPRGEKISYTRNDLGEDKYWDQILPDSRISEFEEKLMMHDLVKRTRFYSQLGLKSKWWGVSHQQRWQHNRLNHSKGVMKIASYLYESACNNSGRPVNEDEKQFLRIGALLHDVGHLPFSHLIEEVFAELNWKPGGYIDSFGHDYYTSEKVRRVFEDRNLMKELERIGYTVEDVISLIGGDFGVGFLDAIINGPIDADKIDYVFRDVGLTKVITDLIEPKKFLEDFCRTISISQGGLLVVHGGSARAAREILKQRQRLYDELYLSQGIRLLEKAVKFIIITYFVYTLNKIEINQLRIDEEIKDRIMDNRFQLSDLGAVRVAVASRALEEMAKKFSSEQDVDIEMKIIQEMKEVLDTLSISEKVSYMINECFYLIETVKNIDTCRDEANKRLRKLDLGISEHFHRERIDKYRYDAKTTILRVPGSVLIDIVSPIEFFKIADRRKARSRSDGTNQGSECIIWDDNVPVSRLDFSRNGKEEVHVNVYGLGIRTRSNKLLD